jgi:putative endonuclease
VTLEGQRLGRRVEELAATALVQAGMVLVARNARAPGVRGEIDLIGLEAGELVFVEVKGRREGGRLGPERPALAVTRAKQLKLRALARAWLAEHGHQLPYYTALRFDVIGVTLDRAGEVRDWEHLTAAF